MPESESQEGLEFQKPADKTSELETMTAAEEIVNVQAVLAEIQEKVATIDQMVDGKELDGQAADYAWWQRLRAYREKLEEINASLGSGIENLKHHV